MKIITILILLISFTSCSNYCNDYLMKQEVEGIITSKYRDRKSHSLKKLEISNNNGRYILVIDDKRNEFWNFVKEGYYLSKKKNSTSILIRKNKEEIVFEMCDN